MKKNTFKTVEFDNRYKNFHNAIRHIDANTVHEVIDYSPEEKAIIDSRIRYNELVKMVNTKPISRASLIGKAVLFLKTYKEVFYSYLLVLGFVIYVIGLFTLLSILFN